VPTGQLYGDCLACGKRNVNRYQGTPTGHFCICPECAERCHREKKTALDLRRENGLPPPTYDQKHRGA
jgi:hypothetical protein